LYLVIVFIFYFCFFRLASYLKLRRLTCITTPTELLVDCRNIMFLYFDLNSIITLIILTTLIKLIILKALTILIALIIVIILIVSEMPDTVGFVGIAAQLHRILLSGYYDDEGAGGRR
jgi:hypothetical protein